jgi:predicted dehydrogenase
VDVFNTMPILVAGTEGQIYVNDGKVYFHSSQVEGADGSEWTDLPEALPHAFDLFLDAVLGQDVPLVTAREAADRAAVMEAFYQAAESNSWVQPKTS